MLAFFSTIPFAAGIAACGGPSATSAVPGFGTLGAPSTTGDTGPRTTLVYVADHKNNLIDVFDRRGALRYTITNGLNAPVGLFVDAGHNLWVANPGANDVLVYSRGALSPARILHDRNQPNDVAVSSDGTAFVADALNAGGVAVFPAGHTMPARRLEAEQSGTGGLEYYVTRDQAGNIFATGEIGASPVSATVGWRHARQSGYYLMPQAAWSYSGIKATRAGTLLIAAYDNSGPAVVEFTEKGKPTGRAISTGGSQLWGDIALDAQQSVVFGADTQQSNVVARKFPGGTIVHTYANANIAQPEGVAVDPGD
ncbi:MAG: hypothetical protein JOY69_08795 [Candidatus Eremiobacteraeota bacterium]|nr:hypothetical protein [Candidatus Eremiobacteraeota bacterium]